MTAFTLTSPTSQGALPTGVTEIGGIVLDLVGTNGVRVVSQLAASSLFVGYYNDGFPVSYRGNPGTIGIQTGITPQIINALGGGLSEVAVRLTVSDGDTGLGDFDRNDNTLVLNGVNFGNFSSVVTQRTDSSGTVGISVNNNGGFRDSLLDTGFFYSNNSATLASFYNTLSTGEVKFQLQDVDPYDNYFDFKQGVDGGLVNVGQTPNISPVAVDDSAVTEENSSVTINVLTNDSDPDNKPQPLSVSAFDANSANGGTITQTSNGILVYTPANNFFGTDTFNYTISDGTATNSAIVTVNVEGKSTISINDITVAEAPNAKASFTVSLNKASSKTISVDYVTVDGSASAGSDFVAQTNSITFAPGETNKTIEVDILNDNVKETAETLFVALNNPTNAQLTTTSGKATITDGADGNLPGYNLVDLDNVSPGANNYTAADKVYKGTNPQDWKQDGAGQISADVGGDNKGYIDYTGTTGNTAGNANDGNAETFTALDGDGSDLNNTGTAQFKQWLNSLVAAGKISGIGVGTETASTSNQGVSNNPEIQSGVGIGNEDRLLIDFGTLTKTASVELALFFGQENVNWRWLSQNYQNPTVNTDVLLNQWSKAAEQMKYQLLKFDPQGSININNQKYSLVQDWQTAKSNGGTFTVGTNANNGDPGIQTVTITSPQAFDTIRFAGQDYAPPTPIVSGFQPKDVSDYLLNSVSLLDQNLSGGVGADSLNAGPGADTINGEADNDTLTGGTGADVFVFDEIAGVDTITDFNTSEGDVIQVSKNGFLHQYNLPLNTSNANFFSMLNFDNTTKSLSFDPDGNAGNAPIEFAKVFGNFALNTTNLVIAG